MTSASLSAWLLRNRSLVLIAALVISIVAGARTVRTYAALKSDIEELLPETAPSVAALAELKRRMPGLRHLGIVIDTGGPENVPAANRFVDTLKARIQAYPKELVGAVRADVAHERQFAETHVFQLLDAQDVKKLREAVEKRRDWEVTRSMDLDLLDESEEPPPKLPIDELRRKYEARHGKPQKLPNDRFVSEDGQTVVLLVQASAHGTGYDGDRELIERVKADVRELRPGQLSVGYAGDVATRVEEMEGLMTDLGISSVIVLLLVVGVIVLFFRSWRAVPLLGLPLMVGTLCTFGLVALPPLSIRYLNSNTAFLGSIVVGNGINSGIILLARFWEERRGGAAVDRAIETALCRSWRPTLAAALAAATAYGSLVFTDFRGFNQFGWIGGLGMIVCWVANMVLIPPLAAVLGAAAAPPSMDRPSLGARISQRLLARPRAVLWATTALSVLALVGLYLRAGDWIEYDLSKLRRRDSWVSGERYWGQRMDQTLRRYLTPTVVLADDAEQARVIEERIRKLASEERAGGLIASVRSMGDVLPPERARAVAEARRLRDVLTPKLKSQLSAEDRTLLERALSDEALRPLSAQDVPEVLVAGLREHDGRLERAVLVFPKLTAATWDVARIERYATDLREAAHVDGRQASVAGSLLLSSDIAKAMQADGPRATLIALIAVLCICGFSFRSIGLSAAAVGSLFSGVTLMLGLLAWTGEKLNFSNFVALPITFGIAADYSINVLKRYQSEGAERLSSALSATSGAVTLCSLTTIIGFGSLLVAQNRALFSFGVFAVTGELTCLLTAILVLPAGLFLALRRSHGRRALIRAAPPSE